VGRISQNTIDLIQNTADIVDVVSDYVTLQPAGKNFKGLCPFHSEKTPSFFVSKERNLFNCFGCHEKGNAITFIQKYKNLSYPEALKELADKYHISLEIDGDDDIVDRFQRSYQINEMTSNFYQLNLTNLDKGKKALAYIQNRGLDIHTIQYFELGYAPIEMDSLFLHLKSDFEPVELMELGLVKKNEKEYYDLFRDRLIFPIRNEYGKVVGFSGRITEEKKNEPKYVNSPLTKLFTKGAILYNLDKALPFINREKRVVLYEGFLDVIASFQAGIKEGVCSMGTALTQEQALLLKKHTNHAVICYDGDDAGFEATAKAIEILELVGLQVSVVLLPDMLDPDEYCKKHSKQAFVKYVNEMQADPVEFEYLYLKRNIDLTKPSQVEDFKLKVFQFLIKKDSQMLLEIYTKKLALDLSVEYETIKSDLHHYQLTKAITKNLSQRHEKISSVFIPDKVVIAERRLIKYFIYAKEYRQIITDELTPYFSKESLNVQIMVNAIDLIELHKEENLKENTILRFDDKTRPLVELRLKETSEEYSLDDLMQLIRTMKIHKKEIEITYLKEDAEFLKQNNRKEYLIVHNQILELKKTIDDLRKEPVWKKPKS
jgi:DNA primase